MTGPFTDLPTVVAHRGNGRGVVEGERENSAAAFRSGVRNGASWVEVDVRRTADDGLCVLHHATVEDGAYVAELTLAQVRDRGVLTLDELLGTLPERVGVMFDVKTCLEDAPRPAPDTTAGVLAATARREAARRPVLATSFDPAAVLHLGTAAPGVSRALTTWIAFPLRKAVPAAAQLGLDAVCAHWKSFTPGPWDPAPVQREAAWTVGVAHEAGLQVAAWCPDEGQARTLLEAGVDALVMDDVPAGAALARGWGRAPAGRP